MKKKIISIILSLTLALSITACGDSSTSEDLSSMDTEELMECIEELEKENEKLHAKLGEDKESDTSKQAEQETWSGDTVIAFANAKQVELVRSNTGIYERDITYGDVKHITHFTSDKDSYGYIDWYGSIEPLKYFDSLCVLNVKLDSSVTSLDGIEKLENLTELFIMQGDSLENIDALSNLTNLTYLRIAACNNLSNLTALSNIPSLNTLVISHDK